MCFSGAMCYMSSGMTMEAKLAGVSKTFGRLVGGGSLFQLTFTNQSPNEIGYIAMTPDYPGVIGKWNNEDRSRFCQIQNEISE